MRFDRFYRYDELTEVLSAWAADRPGLFALESIGRSYEGRDIWLATVTNIATGPAGEKPALWVDANIHATEITGSVAAMHLLHTLLARYGDDEKVTRALDTRAFYVVPRLNPDGTELALADRPRYLRSSARPYPRTDQQDGLIEEDIDGDGRILLMRIADPNGAWKTATEDPRLMVPREPDEAAADGRFYRLLPEGTIQNYDGVTIKVAPSLHGLDLNRNFPMEWGTESQQKGAGPFPTSEPEIRAAVEAIVARPNITGSFHYHTFSGVHLRPYSAHPDEHFPTNDLRVYQLIGKKATDLTGYPAASVFHEFKSDPKDSIVGAADDWMYDHRGVFAWTTEFWSPQRQAGITDYHYLEWFRDHPIEDDLKLLAWVDEHTHGRGWIPWYPFEHPQLGPVELGGPDVLHYFGNPPPELLEQEVAPHSDLAVFHLLISPRLEVRSLDIEPVGDGAHLVRVVVENTGWLPTNITEKAGERKIVRPVELELTLPDGCRLRAGERTVECGQLTGRALKRHILAWDEDATTDRAKAEWIVETPAGATLGIEARHERAGTVRREVRLP